LADDGRRIPSTMRRSPDGSLRGWLRVNFPETADQLDRVVPDSRNDYKDSHVARKRISTSGRYKKSI
jgi:hypothetical protein